MSDPLRTDGSRALDAASESDRDAKIEQLLLAGLDHYFSGEYEQAVNVWTRALFLDRSHPKARAYIERARSALAERQRESEELLQQGVVAFQRGEPEEARRLLELALRRGAPSEEALAVLDRLNRLERGSPAPRAPAQGRAARPTAGARGQADERHASNFSVFAWIVALVLIAAVLVAAGIAAPDIDWRSLVLPSIVPSTVTVPLPEPGLPLPLPGEIALAKARAFKAGGHLREALAALDAVRATDSQKAEADQMRAEIQRQLIDLASIGRGSSDRGKDDGHLP